jgi:hypothetical protein
MKRNQAWFAGPASAVADWLARYADARLTHLVMRFAGDHEDLGSDGRSGIASPPSPPETNPTAPIGPLHP